MPEPTAEIATAPEAQDAKPHRVSGYRRKTLKIERLRRENAELRERVAVLELAIRKIDERIKSQPLTPTYSYERFHGNR